MAAGGWHNVKALQTAYQAADPETIQTGLAGRPGHRLGTVGAETRLIAGLSQAPRR
jgi:hypothetical protein